MEDVAASDSPPSLDRAHSNASTPAAVRALREALTAVIRGQDDAIELALACLFARGHLLLEDRPGTGKTTLARALAGATGLAFRRIQMTADLLPSDLTGARFPVLGQGPLGGPPRFEFVPGPLFSEVVLADELNRTPPRTQSALLECMAEASVTIDGERHVLPSPFFVVATQNPIEFAGTFPLPESQLDRFMMRLSLGYPDLDAERRMLRDRRANDPLAELQPALSRAELENALATIETITVHEAIEDYVLRIVRSTRDAPEFDLGASPRGALDLERAARGLALVDGRTWVSPDDVRRAAVPALAHRLVLRQDLGSASMHDESGGLANASPEARALEALVAGIETPQLTSEGALRAAPGMTR